MATEIQLQRAPVSLFAASTGLLIRGAAMVYAALPAGLALGSDDSGQLDTDLGILREQGIATGHGDGWQISWADWPLALELGASSLLAFSRPSHLMLELDRISEVGRADFRYIVRWREGAREVAVERYGAYLRHSASGRVMHLDPRSLAVLEAVARFNALSPAERQKPTEAWSTLGAVLVNAKELGTKLDEHLHSNVVVIPPTIGLTIREDAAGRISFLPRLGGEDLREAFAIEFERALAVPDVVTVTLPDGRRARVLLTEPQREVLRRMRGVRQVDRERSRPLLADPASVFDGVGDAIDLSDFYGPRVIGVGPLPSSSSAKPTDGPSILEQLGMSQSVGGSDPVSGANVGEPPDGEAPTPLRRVAVSLDVIVAGTDEVKSIRLADESQAKDLLSAVESALDAGAETVRFGDMEIKLEPELAAVLRRHVSSHVETTQEAAEEGIVGRSGHLYLLINDHETSLTPSLEVAALPENVTASSRPVQPAALLPTIALKPHQADGVRWLWTSRETAGRRGGILADDMGLGKTLQVLVHIAGLIEDGTLLEGTGGGRNGPWRPVLIVAPLLLVESGVWTEEMRKCFQDGGRLFEPFVVLRDEGLRKVMHDQRGRDSLGKAILDPAKLMNHKVVITTYETMMAYQHSLAQRVGGRPMWSLVVFDEAQEIKSPTTKQSYAAKAIAASFKLAATGTPVETRLRDLWNLLDTVEDGRMGTLRAFVSRFERPAMNAATAAQRQAALDALREAIWYERPGALVIRRDKSILPDLPQRIEHRIECVLTPLEEETMQRIRGALASEAGRRRPLAALQQLHLCTQHPVLAGASLRSLAANELISSSSRMKALLGILEDIRKKGEKVLIFARSVDAQRLLARLISEALGIPVEIVNGQTGVAGNRAASGAVRREILDRFRAQPGFGAIVLSPFVAGVGLTLTEANHVIHYGRWWNPAIENQATDRAHRIGQTKPVHVYYLIGVHTDRAQPTFDEVLDDLLRDRRELARDFLAPVSEDANAEQLVKRLGASGQLPARPSVRLPASARGVAALMLSIARANGDRAVWLGDDGVYGVHILVAGKAFLSAHRIVERASSDDRRILSAGEVSWQKVLGVPSVQGELVASVSRDVEIDATWKAIADSSEVLDGAAPAIDEALMSAAQNIGDVRQALGLASANA
jgi:superfamily II DNA or RNA helicase